MKAPAAFINKNVDDITAAALNPALVGQNVLKVNFFCQFRNSGIIDELLVKRDIS